MNLGVGDSGFGSGVWALKLGIPDSGFGIRGSGWGVDHLVEVDGREAVPSEGLAVLVAQAGRKEEGLAVCVESQPFYDDVVLRPRHRVRREALQRERGSLHTHRGDRARTRATA